MAAISDRLPAVAIEYTGAKNKRVTKKFKDAYEAKAFYKEKFAAGKEPAVKGEHPNAAHMMATDPAADEETATLTEAVATAAEAHPSPAQIKLRLGVAPTAKTRAYVAGRVIAANGHDKGINAEMIAAVNAEYGSDNDTESRIVLANAWGAIRGLCDVLGLDPATLQPKV